MRIMTVDISVQSVFFIVGTIATVVLTVFLVLVLWRVARILGRVDKVSEDIESVVGNASHFLEEIRKKAIVTGIALAIEKLIKKGRKK